MFKHFAYHVFYVRISPTCKQNSHNIFMALTCCQVKRSQAILKENRKCYTASLYRFICL